MPGLVIVLDLDVLVDLVFDPPVPIPRTKRIEYLENLLELVLDRAFEART